MTKRGTVALSEHRTDLRNMSLLQNGFANLHSCFLSDDFFLTEQPFITYLDKMSLSHQI